MIPPFIPSRQDSGGALSRFAILSITPLAKMSILLHMVFTEEMNKGCRGCEAAEFRRWDHINHSR